MKDEEQVPTHRAVCEQQQAYGQSLKIYGPEGRRYHQVCSERSWATCKPGQLEEEKPEAGGQPTEPKRRSESGASLPVQGQIETNTRRLDRVKKSGTTSMKNGPESKWIRKAG